MYKLPNTVILNKSNHTVLTPNGHEQFLGVNKITEDAYIHLKFSNGKELKCSLLHPLMTIEGIIVAKDLDKKTLVESLDGGCFLIFKRTIRKKIELFDIVNSGKDNTYYTNDIVSHNCEFLGSMNTLIDSAKLQVMGYKEYIEELYGMQIYEHPIKETFCDETQKQLTKDDLYLICSDVSEGKNLDYTTFSVFNISNMPYQQVAVYRNNTISPMLFPDVLKMCAEYYNMAYVLIEINNNPQVADCLSHDLEYENVLKVVVGNKKPQTLVENGKNATNGINMSSLVKRTGCSTLKTLIETNKLVINSFETVSELTTYTVNKNSWSADEGAHDDLVATLVIFAWATTQKLFIEISSTDIRKQLQIENNYARADNYDEEAPPAMQQANYSEKEYFFEDGDLWEIVESSTSYW